jgi:predicted acylesterase/phospholipase RssA
MSSPGAVAGIALIAAAVALTGCGTLPRHPPPVELMSQAKIPEMPDVRAWAGRRSPAMERDLDESFRQESASDFPRGPDGYVLYPHLALSGGGPNGAFGAGFLNGWTKTGQRPVFKIVTGVSTGALMAPFAFLGPKYDDALREFYTTTSSADIFTPSRSLLRQLLAGESLVDTGPLAGLIAKHLDPAFLEQIAEAHRHGRRLYMGTVDLDSQRFVVWNMGLIAMSGRPEALDLFRKVVLASASVPVAFPPVFFDVEVQGQRYDEMHVDGAVGANVFYNGGVFSASAARARAGKDNGREDIFVIHNGQLAPVAAVTPRTLRGIALRTLDSAAKSAVVGDLFRIYAVSLHEQSDFHWVTLPDGIEITGTEFFDPVKMRQLYEVGYRAAQTEKAWTTEPPGWTFSALSRVKPEGAPAAVPAPLPEGAPGSER